MFVLLKYRASAAPRVYDYSFVIYGHDKNVDTDSARFSTKMYERLKSYSRLKGDIFISILQNTWHCSFVSSTLDNARVGKIPKKKASNVCNINIIGAES